MASKKKTLFTVNVGSQVAELFSVRDLGGAGLNLTLRNAINHEELERGNAKILREYVSVHPNSHMDGTGTTLKRTTLLEDGRKFTYAALINDSKANLIWPVLFARTQDPRSLRYAAKPRLKDKSVCLCDFEAEKFSLLYAIFVTRSGINLWEPPEFSVFGLKSETFQLFTVWVYHSFVMVPCDPTGDQIIIATSAPRIDDVPEFQMAKGGTESLKMDEVESCIRTSFRELRIRLFDRITKAVPDLTDAQRNQFEILCSNLVKVSSI